MRVIAFMNQKGGVGKTTTTVNLGAALAEQGQKVCLVDLDPQAHLTINYGVDPAGEAVNLYNVLIDDKSILEAIFRFDNNIAVIPGSIDLAAAEIELVKVLGRELILKKKMAGILDEFDFILLDCPPSLGLLTINALAMADEVIIPMQPHFLALQGFAKLLETVHLVNQRMNPRLRVSGVVLTMFDGQAKLSGEVVAELRRFIDEATDPAMPWHGAALFETRVRRNIKLAESPSYGQHILAYDPTSTGAADYRRLAEEVLAVADAVERARRMSARPGARPVYPVNSRVRAAEVAVNQTTRVDDSPAVGRANAPAVFSTASVAPSQPTDDTLEVSVNRELLRRLSTPQSDPAGRAMAGDSDAA